jgi:transcription elongation factor Elf1
MNGQERDQSGDHDGHLTMRIYDKERRGTACPEVLSARYCRPVIGVNKCRAMMDFFLSPQHWNELEKWYDLRAPYGEVRPCPYCGSSLVIHHPHERRLICVNCGTACEWETPPSGDEVDTWNNWVEKRQYHTMNPGRLGHPEQDQPVSLEELRGKY